MCDGDRARHGGTDNPGRPCLPSPGLGCQSKPHRASPDPACSATKNGFFILRLVRCLAHTEEPCQPLACPPSPWEEFLCPVQDGVAMPDRLSLTSPSISHFIMGGMYSFAGTMLHSGFLGPEWSHTKSRCLVYACMLEGTMMNEWVKGSIIGNQERSPLSARVG